MKSVNWLLKNILTAPILKSYIFSFNTRTKNQQFSLLNFMVRKLINLSIKTNLVLIIIT